MEDVFNAIILGIIQGLTEFLPVSSSGHLELAKFILGEDEIAAQSMLMTVTLHAATALATIFVFWKDVKEIFSGLFQFKNNESFQFSLKIIISMIPAAIIGLLFESQIEALFNKQLLLVGAMLIITGLLLFLADRAKDSHQKVSYKNALIIGIAQAIAILPGISRSGATISCSVLLGVDKSKAARFSFLMVVPLIFGKMAKDMMDGEFYMASHEAVPMLAGFISAFVIGILACTWMIKLVKQSQLKYFAYYCFLVGMAAIAYTMFLS